jgi:uncharacterized membrane protein YhaH (DUF805 family)
MAHNLKMFERLGYASIVVAALTAVPTDFSGWSRGRIAIAIALFIILLLGAGGLIWAAARGHKWAGWLLVPLLIWSVLSDIGVLGDDASVISRELDRLSTLLLAAALYFYFLAAPAPAAASTTPINGQGRTMTFTHAIASGFQNYVNFSGRAVRSEYWWWTLFFVLAWITAILIDHALFSSLQIRPIQNLVRLGLFLPGLAVSIRRLHDLDRTGWWWILVLLPLSTLLFFAEPRFPVQIVWALLVIAIIGLSVLSIWFCMRGTVGSNRFGSDPLAGSR